MAYGNPQGCCCEACLRHYFGSISDQNTLANFTLTGNATNWAVLSSPPDANLTDGTGTCPAASASRTITSQQRNGSQDFTLSGRVGSIFTTSFVSQQTGLYIANAIAIWIDWSTRGLYWAPTDAAGTINPGAATLIFTYGSFPLNQNIQMDFLYNSLNSWNVEIWSTADDGTGGVSRIVLWDQTFTGLTPNGNLVWGITASTGGGSWRDVITKCGASACPNCPDGLPLSWTKVNSAITNVVSDPTTMAAWGCCDLLASGALSPSVTTVNIDATHTRTLHSTALTWWLLTSHPANVGIEDKIYLVAEVVYEVTPGLAGPSLGVAIWSIRRDAWCCYGANAFTLVSPGTDPTYNGFNYQLCLSTNRSLWLQSIAGWPTTITITPVGPGPSTPCTVVCRWVAVKNVITGVLSWVRADDDICAAGTSCSQPVFLPLQVGQTAYTVCV
jgi:hypothetical protein